MSRPLQVAWALTALLGVITVPHRIAELAAHRAAYLAAQGAESMATTLMASQPRNVEPRS